jgi:eukaryotic-like serine/threonine-protein kinase
VSGTSGRGDGATEPIRPGTLSALLQEVIASPEAALGDEWEQRLRPGVVYGRFELVREIGRGGFGVVWEAHDRELGRSVAFKAVRAKDRVALREERLLREAEAAARLSHPNIVTLLDVGRCEVGPYLVLELLQGQTLQARLDVGPIPLREALRIGVDVTKGVAHAHARGVIHRDLKPANVFLCEDGQVKILDFGMAQAFGQRRADGGTPAYMAPEQLRGAPEDERTDVFALGVILHRMFANELPFPDDGGKTLGSSKAAPELVASEAPALGVLVGRMLEKDPVNRPRDAGEVLPALNALQRELERMPSSSNGPMKTRRRWPLRLAGLVVGGISLMALGAFVGARLAARPPEPVEEPRERITVAVADFANQTGEPELNGLSGMLITSLEQSHRLSVLTRVRMLDLLRQLGKTNVETVDETLGRELALNAGVRALVVATIRRFDQIYAIEVKVLDPVTSEYLFTLKDEAKGKSSVPAMIDRLSEQTRERLRAETPAEVKASEVKVADATTSSFEAYQHYFKGDQLKEAIRYEPAIEEYRKAIAIDPDFALPHYRIAYLAEFTHLDPAVQASEMDAALKNVEKVPAKERLLFKAWKAHLDHRNDEAHALYARVVEDYPLDKEALFMAGDLYLHEKKAEKGLPYFERALALDPGWEPAVMHTADCLNELGRFDELKRRSREWVDRWPTPNAYRALSMSQVASGDLDQAVETSRRAFELDGTSFSRMDLAEVLILDERYEDAETLVRPQVGPGTSKLDLMREVPMLAQAIAYQGRQREALRVIDMIPPDESHHFSTHEMRLELLMGDGKPEPVLSEARGFAEKSEAKSMVPMILEWAGDHKHAAEAAQTLNADAKDDLACYEATAAWRAGNRDKAERMFRQLAERPGEDTKPLALTMLVQIAAEGHDDQQVIDTMQAMRIVPGGLLRSWAYPQALYLAALSYEHLGDRGKARETIDRLLRAWKRADPGLHDLAEATALRARLIRTQ